MLTARRRNLYHAFSSLTTLWLREQTDTQTRLGRLDPPAAPRVFVHENKSKQAAKRLKTKAARPMLRRPQKLESHFADQLGIAESVAPRHNWGMLFEQGAQTV